MNAVRCCMYYSYEDLQYAVKACTLHIRVHSSPTADTRRATAFSTSCGSRKEQQEFHFGPLICTPS